MVRVQPVVGRHDLEQLAFDGLGCLALGQAGTVADAEGYPGSAGFRGRIAQGIEDRLADNGRPAEPAGIQVDDGQMELF